jgi:hypothetical protein
VWSTYIEVIKRGVIRYLWSKNSSHVTDHKRGRLAENLIIECNEIESISKRAEIVYIELFLVFAFVDEIVFPFEMCWKPS